LFKHKKSSTEFLITSILYILVKWCYRVFCVISLSKSLNDTFRNLLNHQLINLMNCWTWFQLISKKTRKKTFKTNHSIQTFQFAWEKYFLIIIMSLCSNRKKNTKRFLRRVENNAFLWKRILLSSRFSCYHLING
jgi:hypothetical protein